LLDVALAGVHCSAALKDQTQPQLLERFDTRTLSSPGDEFLMRSSSEAGRLGRRSGVVWNVFSIRKLFGRFLLCVARSFVCLTLVSLTFALAQDSPQTPAAPVPAPSESKPASAEIATHDEPTTFKVNSKLVVVRAVVRDSQGHAIGNLHQEDFQVFDKGKPQVIAQFDVEQPGSVAAKARQESEKNSDPSPDDASSNPGNAPAAPERFVAYLFDDVHIEFGDLARVREAAERHFATLRPTDRAAIFTTSGQTILDFTDDRAKLHETLLRLRPSPINSGIFAHQCPEISYYEADQIVNKHDTNATQVANEEAAECGPQVRTTTGGIAPQGDPAALVNALSMGVLSAGEHESRVSLLTLKDVVHRVSRMPGQRNVVLVSPGFIAPDLEYEYMDVIDAAVRSQIIINALDARGLYVILPYGDASHQPPVIPGDSTLNTQVSTSKTLMETAAASAQADLLSVLADSTGGTFFHNNNDFDEGFRRVAETPEYTYVLAFVPQNLKLDGSYHSLKVTLKSQPKLSLQARRGYYAPKNFANPDEQAKQEIEDEMYSQEELHNLPVKLHTQFFKASDDDAKLIVLAQVDVRHLHFRKVEGRNNDVLTCVSALFNRNGNLVQGVQKVVTMNWKDDTLEHKLNSGITLKTSFDVKPGSYLVRLVVRDAEGQLMSAENGTVDIR
jgi:VWFA-related protein